MCQRCRGWQEREREREGKRKKKRESLFNKKNQKYHDLTKNHFHQNPITPKTFFIKIQFYPKPFHPLPKLPSWRTLAKPTLASFLTDFGQLWAWPNLAKPTLASFSVDRLWPNGLLTNLCFSAFTKLSEPQKKQRPKDPHSDLNPKPHSKPETRGERGARPFGARPCRYGRLWPVQFWPIRLWANQFWAKYKW